jgi:hypothetical protein
VHVRQPVAEHGRRFLGALACEQRVARVQAGAEARLRREHAGDLGRPCERLVPVVLDRERDRERHALGGPRGDLGGEAPRDHRRVESLGEGDGPRRRLVVLVVEPAGADGHCAQAPRVELARGVVGARRGVADPQVDEAHVQARDLLERRFQRQGTERIRVDGEPHERVG